MATRTVQRTRKSRLTTFPRDTILFFSGLVGVIHETIFAEQDRAQLLLLFGAMMGLPAFLRADAARTGAPGPEEKPEETKE